MAKHTKVQIKVKWLKNGKVVGTVTAHTMNRIANRCPGRTIGRFDYYARVRYVIGKYKTATGELAHVDNEFEATSKHELMEKLRIFAGAEEVKFARNYWANNSG